MCLPRSLERRIEAFLGVVVWASWGHGLRYAAARLQWPPFGVRPEFPNGLARTKCNPPRRNYARTVVEWMQSKSENGTRPPLVRTGKHP